MGTNCGVTFFIVGVLPLCFSSLLPNYSYFKEKADGKD